MLEEPTLLLNVGSGGLLPQSVQNRWCWYQWSFLKNKWLIVISGHLKSHCSSCAYYFKDSFIKHLQTQRGVSSTTWPQVNSPYCDPLNLLPPFLALVICIDLSHQRSRKNIESLQTTLLKYKVIQVGFWKFYTQKSLLICLTSHPSAPRGCWSQCFKVLSKQPKPEHESSWRKRNDCCAWSSHQCRNVRGHRRTT